jgi:hypothetical protein
LPRSHPRPFPIKCQSPACSTILGHQEPGAPARSALHEIVVNRLPARIVFVRKSRYEARTSKLRSYLSAHNLRLRRSSTCGINVRKRDLRWPIFIEPRRLAGGPTVTKAEWQTPGQPINSGFPIGVHSESPSALRRHRCVDVDNSGTGLTSVKATAMAASRMAKDATSRVGYCGRHFITKEGAQALDAATMVELRTLPLADGHRFRAEPAHAQARTPFHNDA